MKRLGAVILLAALLPGLALAAYESGSTLEADAPVTLKGRADALVNKGLVSIVSQGGGDNLLFTLKGLEMEVRTVSVPPACQSAPGVPACAPEAVTSSRPVETTFSLTDATVTVVKPLGAFKAVALNDPSAYGGNANIGTPGPLATTTADGTLFTTHAKERYLSPFQSDWSEAPPTNAATADVYTAEAKQGVVNATNGGSLRGVAGLQVLLQGVSVRVTGTTEEGQPFDETFDMPAPRSASEPVQYLDAQTPNGVLNAASRAPLLAHGVSIADAVGGAAFTAAQGKIVSDGRENPVDGEDTTLAGPLSLTLSKVVDGAPMRLAFALSSSLRIADNLPQPDEQDETDTTALVAAGAAGASAAGLLAAIAWFWPRLKFGATLLLLPLYSRIERTAVLEHEKRDEIYGLIRATPGIHAHEIGEKAQIGWGTTVYHLKLLEQHSLIVSQKSGRYKRFFVNTGEYTKKKDVYGALRNDTAKAVAQYVVEHPGITQKELCAALNIQPSLASWHVEKLEGVELIKRVKDGRQVRYYAGPAWSQLNVRIDPRGGGEGVAET